jgi:hypothetical protein
MKTIILAFAFTAIAVGPSFAFEATITRVAPGAAAPVTAVDRSDLAPLPGVPISPSRAPAAYVFEAGPRSSGSGTVSNVPVPLPRPVQALGCPIVFAD